MVKQNSSTSKPTLNELALRHGTDKSSTHHNYVEIYEKFLSTRRNENMNILELGWGGHEDPDKGVS